MKKAHTFILLLAILAIHACSNKPVISSIEGCNIPVTATAATERTSEISLLLERGAKSVDSIKAPIIGTAAKTLTVKEPESSLMNFAADALRAMAEIKCNENIDIAITNKGGLRSELHEGNITFGDIYNVFPFDNTLTLLTLDGEQLMRLFKEIAKEKGEAISGATLTITDDWKLVEAKVGNKPVKPDKKYRIATSDYLSQGNDGLTTLAEGCEQTTHIYTIRDLMIEYIAHLHKAGKAVNSDVDGRITIIK